MLQTSYSNSSHGAGEVNKGFNTMLQTSHSNSSHGAGEVNKGFNKHLHFFRIS
jgi:hypothetical protein